jgi:hypothetical protein
MGTRHVAVTVFLLTCAIAAANCAAVAISFDLDPNGNPLVAPPLFENTTPLRTLYAPLGVTFAGPAPLDGGAILDESSNFGVPARSGRNFLAFNRKEQAVMANGGHPRDPETLQFNPPASAVSIFASGGSVSGTFRMEAFDGIGTPLGSSTASNAPLNYVEVAVSSATPIAFVVLTETTGGTLFVYDDLNFTPIPEPAAALALLSSSFALLRRSRRGARSAQR